MTTQKHEIVNHISQQLYERIEQFKEQQKLSSVSQAVNTILEDYFGLESSQTTTSKHLTQIVEELKNEVAQLKRQMSQIDQKPTSDRLNQSKNTNSQGKLLNRTQLAARLEVKQTDIEQHKTDGNEFVEWTKSKEPERIPWRYTGANLFERV